MGGGGGAERLGQDVEREYWGVVEAGNLLLRVEYGSDLDVATHGRPAAPHPPRPSPPRGGGAGGRVGMRDDGGGGRRAREGEPLSSGPRGHPAPQRLSRVALSAARGGAASLCAGQSLAARVWAGLRRPRLRRSRPRQTRASRRRPPFWRIAPPAAAPLRLRLFLVDPPTDPLTHSLTNSRAPVSLSLSRSGFSTLNSPLTGSLTPSLPPAPFSPSGSGFPTRSNSGPDAEVTRETRPKSPCRGDPPRPHHPRPPLSPAPPSPPAPASCGVPPTAYTHVRTPSCIRRRLPVASLVCVPARLVRAPQTASPRQPLPRPAEPRSQALPPETRARPRARACRAAGPLTQASPVPDLRGPCCGGACTAAKCEDTDP